MIQSRDKMIKRLNYLYLASVFLMLMSFSVLTKACGESIISSVLHSAQLLDYKSARGLDLIAHHAGDSFQLIESSVEPITEDEFYIEAGYIFLVSLTYGWNNNQTCTLYFPVKAEDQKVIEIGAGISDGGCGE